MPGTAVRFKVLSDAAGLLKALGSVGDADWLLEFAESLTAPNADKSQVPTAAEGFALAAIVNELPTTDGPRRSQLARALAVAAADNLSAVHDLDVYEALPDDLKAEPELQALARDRAQSVIESERQHLLRATSDPEAVESAALDLDQRAKWHGIEVDVGQILDHAEDLAQQTASLPAWPDALDEPGDGPDGPRADMHQLFLSLGTDAADE